MKILILSWRCIKNPSAGGAELYFHEMAKRWVKNGNEVTWFSPMFKGALNKEMCDGIKIIRKGNRASVYFFAFFNYITGKLGKDYDVIIDVENGLPFFSPFYISKRKVVLHMHHVHKEQWFKEFRFPISWIGYFLGNYMMPLVYSGVRIFTISKSSASGIADLRISNYKPVIVNPGIEFYNRPIGKKSNKPSVLFLNRIKKYKGIETFLEAARLIQDKNPEIEFLVAGGGEYLEEAKQYAAKNKLKNTIFLGRVSEKKKRELMQKAWVFVNPSLNEGWGIVNIEANYAGTVAIGSNVGGIRDSIVEGKTGILFPYGNSLALASKIKLVIDNSKLRKIMEKNAILWSKNFDWDSKAKQYLEALNRLVNK